MFKRLNWYRWVRFLTFLPFIFTSLFLIRLFFVCLLFLAGFFLTWFFSLITETFLTGLFHMFILPHFFYTFTSYLFLFVNLKIGLIMLCKCFNFPSFTISIAISSEISLKSVITIVSTNDAHFHFLQRFFSSPEVVEELFRTASEIHFIQLKANFSIRKLLKKFHPNESDSLIKTVRVLTVDVTLGFSIYWISRLKYLPLSWSTNTSVFLSF